jgi:hypothetical protein
MRDGNAVQLLLTDLLSTQLLAADVYAAFFKMYICSG